MSNINIRRVKDAVTKEEFYPQTCIEAVVDENGDALGIDASPTDDSDKLVRSGGVKAAIDNEATARASADSALGTRIDGANIGIQAAMAAVSAEQQRAMQAENAKYVKPAGGIPKADLASDVQASLELAQDVVYDISAHNNNTAYADLAAALGTGGANIPQAMRKGGMSVKYVQSSDNNSTKYVQYRLMKNQFSLSETDWQGMDEEPTAGSENLVSSGGVYDELNCIESETITYLKINGASVNIYNNKIIDGLSTSYIVGYVQIPNDTKYTSLIVTTVDSIDYAYIQYIGASETAPEAGTVCTKLDFTAFTNSGNTVKKEIPIESVKGKYLLFSYHTHGVPQVKGYFYANKFNVIENEIDELEERIEDVEKQVRPEQIVYKNDSQDITNCSKGYNAEGHAVFCANAKDSLFDTVDIPFSSSSGIINATLLIGQTNSTGEIGVRDALSQQNLLVEKTIQLGSDIKYKRIDLGESIKITKDNAVVAVTYSSNMPAVYHASHDGMSDIGFFYLNGNWYRYSGNYNEKYGAYPRFIKSAGEVIQRWDALEEEVDALEEEILEDIGIYLPDTLYAVVGDTLQLFHRAIIKVPNPSVYDVQIVCSKGKDYPRYFEYAPTVSDVGQTTLTIYVKNSNRKVLAQKSCTLMTVNVVSSPSSAKKVLCFGDSLTVSGTWCAEAYRRLTGSGGTPEGKNLSNIAFCGSMTKNGAGYFGVGGWTWNSYITKGSGNYYRFQVSGVSTLNIDAVYTNNGNTFTIKEVNVTEGSGNILCAVSSLTPTPLASGTLTKQSGNGDATIMYSSVAEDSTNPLWDTSQNKMSFIPYANEVSNGNIDVVYVLLGWNQVTPAQTNFTSLINQVKTFADTLHSEFSSAKLKIVGLQINSLTGGMAANYGASGGYSDEWGIAIAAWNLNKAYIDFANSADYSGFVEYVDIASQFDTEYNMPYTNKDVNTRNSDKKELVGTNGVHPSTSGYYQIADSIYRNVIKELCQ